LCVVLCFVVLLCVVLCIILYIRGNFFFFKKKIKNKNPEMYIYVN
jgi:hypothetical protein